jgi:antitoxin CptB
MHPNSKLSDSDINRVYWASRRGMLELDLVLMPFAKGRLRDLDPIDQQCYIRLLECEDTELFVWFMRRERPQDEELAGIVDQILAFAKTAAR